MGFHGLPRIDHNVTSFEIPTSLQNARSFYFWQLLAVIYLVLAVK